MTKLSLQNPLVTKSMVRSTPSSKHDIPFHLELELRRYGCHLIQTASTLLNLPQPTIAVAQVLLHRFYFKQSLYQHNLRKLVLATLFLATKVQETQRHPIDIINSVTCTLFYFRNPKAQSFKPYELKSTLFQNIKLELENGEMEVLKYLGFNVHVQLPYTLLVTYLKVLELDTDSQFVQTSWNYLNDSLLTPVYVYYDISTITCAVIHLTSLDLKYPLPNSPPWYWVFETDMPQMEVVFNFLLQLKTYPLNPNLPVTHSEMERYLNKINR